MIRGNYFHDFDTAIMAPDGGQRRVDHRQRVRRRRRYRPAIQLGGHHGTLFAHNVTTNIDVYIDAKSGDPPAPTTSRATTCCRRHGGVTGFQVHELHRRLESVLGSRACATGGGAVVATPVFAGGPSPSDWAGHVLADSSPGRIGSDGTNRGHPAAAGPDGGAAGLPSRLAPEGPRAKAEGLVAAYGFNEAKGAWAADSSGAGHRAKLRRARHTKVAKAGMALRFGAGASLQLPRAASKGLREAVTLEAWVRPAARASAARARLGAVRAPALRARRWSHLALVYAGGRLRTYVNGRLADSRRAKSPVGSRALVIRGLRGQLDDLRVYRRPLAAAEIRGDLKRPA